MILYNWEVYKNCRIVGYVAAYSEYDALRKAQTKYGQDIFLQRSPVAVVSRT
jgi:hypothetical protein